VKKVDLLLTSRHVTLVGREKVKKGINKGKMEEVIKRQLPLDKISSIGLSPFQDDFFVITVDGDYSSLLETPLKTEFLTAFCKRYKERTGVKPALRFVKSHNIVVKKTNLPRPFSNPAERQICFTCSSTSSPTGRVVELKAERRTLNVSVQPGLPNNTRPTNQPNGHSMRSDHVTPYASTATYNLNTNRARQFGQPRAVFPVSTPMHAKGNGVEDPVNSASRKQHAQPMRPRPAPKPKPAQIRPKRPCVKALYNYEPQDTDELGFQAGQIIELVDKADSGWWSGQIGQRTGLFPYNYVEAIE